MNPPPAEEPAADPALRRHVDRSIPPYPGMPWRRRLLFVLVAIAMGWAVVTTMVDPPGGIKRNPPPRADAPPCAPGQNSGCVGGTAQVIVAPAPAAASR